MTIRNRRCGRLNALFSSRSPTRGANYHRTPVPILLTSEARARGDTISSSPYGWNRRWAMSSAVVFFQTDCHGSRNGPVWSGVRRQLCPAKQCGESKPQGSSPLSSATRSSTSGLRTCRVTIPWTRWSGSTVVRGQLRARCGVRYRRARCAYALSGQGIRAVAIPLFARSISPGPPR